MKRNVRGFTLVDLLTVLAIVVILGTLVLTAGARTGNLARGLSSADNLRVLSAAHASYAADWNDRQFTLIDDAITTYGPNLAQAMNNYWTENGFCHPPATLGWGRLRPDDRRYVWLAYGSCGNCANAVLTIPVEFTGDGCNPALAYFGSFRLNNIYQMNQYLDGRFYDEVFYPANDEVVFDAVDDGGCFDVPDGFCRFAIVSDDVGDIPAWSSYSLSPAGMFNPAVMAHDDPDDETSNGFVDPWELDDGYASPSVAQALYPGLKSHLIEQHWLQNNPGETCNPAFDPGTYGKDGCEPYYFNHAAASSPLALFYDGHVAEIGVQDAVDDDALIRDQNGPQWGLWSQDTPWGADGYLSEFGFDGVQTSFHILTTDGIRGRDILAPGARSRERSSALARTLPARRATAPHRADSIRPGRRITLTAD